jgi:hypothetical protein
LGQILGSPSGVPRACLAIYLANHAFALYFSARLDRIGISLPTRPFACI